MYRLNLFILVILHLIQSACLNDSDKQEKAAQRNKFIKLKNDPNLVPLDSAARLNGTWGGRVALMIDGKGKVWLGTIEFDLKESSGGDLYFGTFSWLKVVEPNVQVDSFTGKKTAAASTVIIDQKTSSIIPSSYTPGQNELRLKNDHPDDRLLDFKIDFTKDPQVSSVAKSITNGLIWVSRDAKTLIGSNGSDLYFIAQNGVPPKEVSLSDINGDWEITSYQLLPSTKRIYVSDGISQLSVLGASSEFDTTFKGYDADKNEFSGSIFMPDKILGGSLIDFKTLLETKQGGMLISPDGTMVYGVFFPKSKFEFEHGQFIGVKKNL